jgi:alpha-ketoglutarate-dependent taurine dioxygenase
LWEPERVDVGHPAASRRLIRALSEGGLALLDGVTDADVLLDVARSIATVIPHRDSRIDGVTVLTDRGDATCRGFAGFGRQELIPHTDRSGLECPPGLLMMACGGVAEQGGECVVVDGAAVYDDLAANEPEALEALSAPRSALFGGAAGHLGSVFARQPDGQVTVRLRLDELARFSPEVSQWRATLRSTIERHTTVIPLRVGAGYVLNNRRWLHGRRAFIGNRVLYRITADPLPHLAIPVGFRPTRVSSCQPASDPLPVRQ